MPLLVGAPLPLLAALPLARPPVAVTVGDGEGAAPVGVCAALSLLRAEAEGAGDALARRDDVDECVVEGEPLSLRAPLGVGAAGVGVGGEDPLRDGDAVADAEVVPLREGAGDPEAAGVVVSEGVAPALPLPPPPLAVGGAPEGVGERVVGAEADALPLPVGEPVGGMEAVGVARWEGEAAAEGVAPPAAVEGVGGAEAEVGAVAVGVGDVEVQPLPLVEGEGERVVSAWGEALPVGVPAAPPRLAVGAP